MKKIALIMFTLLLISMLGLIFNVSLIKAHPEIIYVDDNNITGPWNGTPEHPYQNITSGLAHASDGDTIFVYNGTYYEHLIVNKPLSLTGENKHNTIIDGSTTGNVIEITANNVSITNFTIRNSGSSLKSGIDAQNVSNIKISHNIITNNYKGIDLRDSSHNTFTSNNISSNTWGGIRFEHSDNNTVTGNIFSNNGFGIFLLETHNNLIYHNNAINNSESLASLNSIDSLDNGAEGNYWSDYTGKDENQDGIGESPYIINANNQDNHPLTGTFSDFTVIYEKETHHVFTICNSTISQFQFNETPRMLNFKVTGINNTAGFCRIMIPEQITHKPHIVLIDDQQVNTTSLPISNLTHTFLYFTYNHSTREIKILSKPYYELLEKYNTLLENYHNLNSTYYQLLADHNLLNQTYQQLLADYDLLNKTYWQVLTNYTQLQADYNLLNQTYQETVTNYTTLKNEYHSLSEEYGLLNQTYQQVLANYTELLAKYQELMTNHTKLQNDYNSIQTDHNDLQEQYNSLNSTYNKIESEYTNTQITLWCISAAAVAITAITSSLTIKYGKRSKEQKKLLKKYKSELERISLLDVARTQFETDVQRRKEKIEKFKNKYGITVRPRNTLEDVIRSLELKRKKED